MSDVEKCYFDPFKTEKERNAIMERSANAHVREVDWRIASGDRESEELRRHTAAIEKADQERLELQRRNVALYAESVEMQRETLALNRRIADAAEAQVEEMANIARAIRCIAEREE